MAHGEFEEHRERVEGGAEARSGAEEVGRASQADPGGARAHRISSSSGESWPRSVISPSHSIFFFRVFNLYSYSYLVAGIRRGWNFCTIRDCRLGNLRIPKDSRRSNSYQNPMQRMQQAPLLLHLLLRCVVFFHILIMDKAFVLC